MIRVLNLFKIFIFQDHLVWKAFTKVNIDIMTCIHEQLIINPLHYTLKDCQGVSNVIKHSGNQKKELY